MSSFTIRIFGSKNCEKCQAFVKALEFHSIPFIYVDSDDAKNDKLCDENKVDALPHIQAIYNDNNKVFHTNIGYINPLTFIQKASEHTSQLDHFLEINKKVAHAKVNVEEIKRQINDEPRQKRCTSCSRKNKTQ